MVKADALITLSAELKSEPSLIVVQLIHLFMPGMYLLQRLIHQNTCRQRLAFSSLQTVSPFPCVHQQRFLPNRPHMWPNTHSQIRSFLICSYSHYELSKQVLWTSFFGKGSSGAIRSGLGRSDCNGKSPGYLSLYESHSGKKIKNKIKNLGRICLLCEWSLNFFKKGSSCYCHNCSFG